MLAPSTMVPQLFSQPCPRAGSGACNNTSARACQKQAQFCTEHW